jgi:opacity protein-like surface antigen
MVPFTATVRWLPIGRQGGFVPYLGAGVGIINYKYSESGDFVDFSDCAPDGSCSLFHDTFTGSGTATGPLFLGGARFPVGPVGIGGEIRYQHAKGDLPASEDFAGSKIDLGGFSYLATVNLKF